MFKVLIVDDEPMAIEAIKLAADWDKLGLSVCGECTNGKEALRLAEEIRPDLIITDADMPVMNGIELVKRVAEDIDPDIKFILISGHERFEYVKSAMRLGVQHYILKPVFKEEFTEVLLQLLPGIEQSKKLKNIYSASAEVDVGILFERYLSGKAGEAEIRTALGSKLLDRDTAWAFASLDTIHNYDMHEFDKDEYVGFKIIDKIKGSLISKGMKDIFIYPVFVNKGISGFVLCSNGEASIYEISQTLCALLKEIYNNGFYLSVGNPVEEISQLRNSMKEAEKTMCYRFYSTPGSILQYRDYTEREPGGSFENIAYMEELQNAFENIDIDRILKAIDSIFKVFKEEHIAGEMIEMYLNSIIYKSLSILTAMGEGIESIPFISDAGLLFSTGKTINETEEQIKKYCIDFCKHAQEIKSRYKMADMLKVEEYINENFRRSITIKEISSKLYIHPTYLGSQISKWFGCSFNDYLHSLRMKEAGRLIKCTNQTVHDIAENLGYTSYGSFLEQFTKAYSMKPSEYRSKFKANT
ncbi:two-component system response regulator YesN [Ruminiclostridium sufflavum DSM 19573]|uniref:Stage 0 sporulation protein A homolog n=1 Tax=Ruminiclostridium sufflavum DSM 19573 TaxID=1121337 RepID=A0A318XSG1_9FIRM|nr:response regulator [Ruminiclostridium sufflavum]PYG89181.1 two-component system response regulator YesN [Ruminiclostridium sufflavum DSM 19573]